MQLRVQVMRRVARAVAVLAAAVCAGGLRAATATPTNIGANEIVVYVPCGMELPFMAAKKAVEAANPGLTVDIVLDNNNIIVKRIIEKGETPDLVVSPGTLEVEMLAKAGKIRLDTVKHFGRYELVLFGPRANPAGISKIAELVKPEVKTIALADPAVNSVGWYTQQALTAMGLWDKLKGKMVFTDEPSTAYKYVAREKAEASFAYRSCPLKTAPDKLEYSKVRIMESVPQNLYGPAYACIAPLTASGKGALTAKLVDYLFSEAGRAMLNQYEVPPADDGGQKLLISVPCSLTGPIFSVRRGFEEKHPGFSLLLDFYCSDVLSEKLKKQDARPDVHVSIGKVETELMVTAGLVEANTAVPFGRVRVALTVPQARKDAVTKLEDLAKPEVKVVLMPSPETSSLGACAKAAMVSAGVWEKVAPKVQNRPTIMECHKGLIAGQADASFAYVGYPISADPAKAEYSKVVPAQVLDDSLFGGALACGSVVTGTAHPKEAAEFVQFLASPEVVAMLGKVGVLPLPAK